MAKLGCVETLGVVLNGSSVNFGLSSLASSITCIDKAIGDLTFGDKSRETSGSHRFGGSTLSMNFPLPSTLGPCV